MTNEKAKGRLESFIDTFNICKEHDNALVAVSISKEDIQAFTQAIKALEQQPCEDAISRSEALSVFRPRGITEDVWKECDVYKKLTALPSVTPKEKTGRWIMPQQDDGMSEPIYYQVRCSKCNFDLDPQTWNQELHQYNADKYCPNCGARMVSE